VTAPSFFSGRTSSPGSMVHRSNQIRMGIPVAKGCVGVFLRTFRTANCVASRFAPAHRQLVIINMTFLDYLASMMFYEGRIALLLVCQIFYEKCQRELASRSLSSYGRRTSRQSIVSYVEGMR
jgi:hypothetical protein